MGDATKWDGVTKASVHPSKIQEATTNTTAVVAETVPNGVLKFCLIPSSAFPWTGSLLLAFQCGSGRRLQRSKATKDGRDGLSIATVIRRMGRAKASKLNLFSLLPSFLNMRCVPPLIALHLEGDLENIFHNFDHPSELLYIINCET